MHNYTLNFVHYFTLFNQKKVCIATKKLFSSGRRLKGKPDTGSGFS